MKEKDRGNEKWWLLNFISSFLLFKKYLCRNLSVFAFLEHDVQLLLACNFSISKNTRARSFRHRSCRCCCCCCCYETAEQSAAKDLREMPHRCGPTCVFWRMCKYWQRRISSKCGMPLTRSMPSSLNMVCFHVLWFEDGSADVGLSASLGLGSSAVH